MMSICSSHILDLIKANNNLVMASLSDFTLAFNLHSFTEFFIANYGNKVSSMPNEKLITKIKKKWLDCFDKDIKPIYLKELEARKEILFEQAGKAGENKKEASEIYS